MGEEKRASAGLLARVASCQALTRIALTIGAEHPNANELAEVEGCGSALSPKDAAARCVLTACAGDIDRARRALDSLSADVGAIARRPYAVWWWGWLARPTAGDDQARPHRRTGRAATGAPRKNTAADWRGVAAAVEQLAARPVDGNGLPIPKALGKANAIKLVALSLKEARGLAWFKTAREYVYHALKKFGRPV